jgi:hypothetical protein
MKDLYTALQELQAIYKRNNEQAQENFSNTSCVIDLRVEVTLSPGADDKPGTYRVLLHPFPNDDDDGCINAWDETGLTEREITQSLNIESSSQIWTIEE